MRQAVLVWAAAWLGESTAPQRCTGCCNVAWDACFTLGLVALA